MSTRNLRVQSVRTLLPPGILMEEIPISDVATSTVEHGRRSISNILSGDDDRLVVVVGPCSIHDPKAAIEYAERLKPLADKLHNDLCLVMRVYFEKPRTTVGWKGLINDPNLDGSFQINEGLRAARQLLLDLAGRGMPCATEFLDLITPQFLSDLVSWGAIGARTTESQTHRELASGLSMPIGFKNGTDGGTQIAVDAVMSAAHPHRFVGVTEQGLAAIFETKGNLDCHVILRGGKTGPNFDGESIKQTAESLKRAELRPCVMVDCSHGNSNKDHRRQAEVARAMASQVARGNHYVIGLMIESNLVEGRQNLGSDPKKLLFGQSITDACMSFDMTVPLLEELAAAVQKRRQTPRETWGPPAIDV